MMSPWTFLSSVYYAITLFNTNDGNQIKTWTSYHFLTFMEISNNGLKFVTGGSKLFLGNLETFTVHQIIDIDPDEIDWAAFITNDNEIL